MCNDRSMQKFNTKQIGESMKKGGGNPKPTTPKPNITPPPQKPKK